ncbi:MAG: toprim domain-containing protein, partial [Gammaproteobacteria bacterium]
NRFEMERIKEELNQYAEKISTEILGEPKLRGSNFIKFGSNQGSLSVTTKGDKQGWWNDFSGDGGGKSMLSFIQKQLMLSKKEATQYAAKWLGYANSPGEQAIEYTLRKENKSKLKSEKKQAQENTLKIDFAKKLAEQSRSAQGTIVEKYLKDHRGISMSEFPDDVRFHPGVYSKLNGKTYPAMLVIARDRLGKVKAVQATYLDPNTATKIDKSDIKIQKQTFGVMSGAAVTIKGKTGEPVLIAEGAETGLSLSKAMPNVTVKITLSKSNFLNLDTKTVGKNVVFCLDNDGKNIQKDKVISTAATRLNDHKKDVFIMIPTSLKTVKQDYNDILKQSGEESIRRDFNKAIYYEDFFGISKAQSATLNLKQSQISAIINTENRYHTDKTIDRFVSKMTSNNHHQEQAKTHVNIQREPGFKENVPATHTSKLKDFDREI